MNFVNEQEMCERLNSAEQSVKSAHHRLDELSEHNKSVMEILVEMKYMRRDLNRLIERMNTIESAPVRRYDHIVNAVITTLIAAAVSFIINRFS